MREVPDTPYESVATDIFTLRGKDYLITVDTFSTFIEVDRLHSTTSEEIIHKLKAHFARHGSPSTVISDNGPQYSSAAFAKFAKEWQFRHQTSSPGDSQSNGAAEAVVKSAKRLLRKCFGNQEDPYVGLLNLRNTPTEGLETSPAQRLMGRRTRSLLPASEQALRPAAPPGQQARMASKKMKAAERHCAGRALAPLKSGEGIRVQPIRQGQREWQHGIVQKHLDGRSYEILTEGGRTLRRTRKHLRKSNAPPDALTHTNNTAPPSNTPPSNTPHSTPPEMTPAESTQEKATTMATTPRVPETSWSGSPKARDETVRPTPEPTQPVVSRSGRMLCQPARLRDFVVTK